jgi:predicted glycosyltransferase
MNPSGTESMRVLLTLQHPGHVHFFKHAYRELRANGHEVAVVVRNEPVVAELCEAYDIEYRVLCGAADSLPSLAATQLRYEIGLFRFARKFSPDVIAAIGGVAAAHVARLTGTRGIVFTDTEHATLSNALAFPFADLICTPSCYEDDLGLRQYRYPGYHELAYLTPNRFTPNQSVLETVGVDPEERFVVFRLSSWNALHDVGQGGFDDAVEAVEHLEAMGVRVLIASSSALPTEIESRQIDIEPHRLHDLLAYATLFVGEGATTATESAVLGTPAVYVNTLSAGTLTELEERYGLLFGFHGPDRHRRGLERAIEILESADRERWERRRRRLLSEKCDTTSVVTGLLTEQLKPRGEVTA